MRGTTSASLAIVAAGGFFFLSAVDARAQCCGSSGRSSQGGTQGSSMQSALFQQQYMMQQMAMQQRYLQQAALQQQFLQQQALVQQQQANPAVLTNNRNSSSVSKVSYVKADKQIEGWREESEAAPVDPEMLAANALKFVRPLTADANRRTFARIQLRQIVTKYPATAAASEAQELLAKLQ